MATLRNLSPVCVPSGDMVPPAGLQPSLPRPPRDAAAALGALEALGIAPLRDRLYTAISGGQRQLVLIARALAQDTGYVVMDEPTASLDFGNQVLVLRTIRRLARQQGKGIVLSTHDPDHVLALGDLVAVMGAGGLEALGAPGEILTSARLSRLYGVRVDVEMSGTGSRICVPHVDEA